MNPHFAQLKIEETFNQRFLAKYGEPMDSEQLAVLRGESDDCEELPGMLHDWEARMGIEVADMSLMLLAVDIANHYEREAVGDISGEDLHKRMILGCCTSETFNPNTGGNIWLSFSKHGNDWGEVLALVTIDGIFVYDAGKSSPLAPFTASECEEYWVQHWEQSEALLLVEA